MHQTEVRSLDPLALDSFAARSMGFDPSQILYLSSMNMVGMGQGDPDQIRTIGNTLEEIQQRFQPAKGLIDVYNLG